MNNRYRIYKEGNDTNIENGIYKKLLKKLTVKDNESDKEEEIWVDAISLIDQSDFWSIIFLGTKEGIKAEYTIEYSSYINKYENIKLIIDYVHGREIEEQNSSDLFEIIDLCQKYMLENLAIKILEKNGAYNIKNSNVCDNIDENNYLIWIKTNIKPSKWYIYVDNEDSNISKILCLYHEYHTKTILDKTHIDIFNQHSNNLKSIKNQDIVRFLHDNKSYIIGSPDNVAISKSMNVLYNHISGSNIYCESIHKFNKLFANLLPDTIVDEILGLGRCSTLTKKGTICGKSFKLIDAKACKIHNK